MIAQTVPVAITISDVIQLGGLAAVILVPIMRSIGSLRSEFMQFKIEQAKVEGSVAGDVQAIRSEQSQIRSRVSRLEEGVFSKD